MPALAGLILLSFAVLLMTGCDKSAPATQAKASATAAAPVSATAPAPVSATAVRVSATAAAK
jgi:hypothetical protein